MRRLDADKLRQRIEDRVAADLAAERVSGVVILVRQEGELLYQGIFGRKRPGRKQPDQKRPGQNLPERNTPDGKHSGDEQPGWEEPLAPDALFRMASMTKPITAAAVLLQAARGLLSLDNPVERYLPAYRNLAVGRLDEKGVPVFLRKAGTKLTLRHLLTHTGGVGCGALGEAQYRLMDKKARQTLAGVVDYHAKSYLAFEPFTAEAYSPVVGFDILARIVELTSGTAYDAFLRKELFEPLGMTDTTFSPTPAEWKRMIVMHDRVDGKSVEGKMVPHAVFADFPTTYFCGGAGLASTAADYSAFAEMLLNEGRVGRARLLPAALVREMARPQLPASLMGPSEVWGLGVRVIAHESYRRLPVGAFGWSGAYGTHFWVDPVNRITAVYLKNSLYDGGSGARTAALFEQDVTGALSD